MKVIAVYNHKGGIGKTVTAVNFAYDLSVKGKRVLVVDLDPQGNASSFYQRYDLNKPSIKEVLTGEKAADRCIRRTKYQAVDIIQGNLNLREVTAETLRGGKEALSDALRSVTVRYDYCIIDCPPSVDYLIEVIMAAADDVIIPLNPDRFSADGLGSVLDIIREFGGQRITSGCLFTKFYRNKDTLQAVREIIRTTEIGVYDNVIRRCSAVDHSTLVRKPLAKCASRSAAAQDYVDFTAEYLEREVSHGIA